MDVVLYKVWPFNSFDKSTFLCIILSVFTAQTSFCQISDTTIAQEMMPVTIEGQRIKNDIRRLEPIVGTYIFSGKKNEVISLASLDASITEKTGRQIFSKVPGVFVYDMEGGNQLNISTRGLDPHRGWEFNLRKDGILANSDLYAYPASHYSIPMESVERIELVRGTGALQYGAQFGGMLNYVIKQGDENKPLSFESFNTVGSFNLLSTYNAFGGKSKKLRYYAYFTKRTRDGYRKNEGTAYDAQGINLTYEANENLSIRLDWARSNYIYRIPGPLTDAMFAEDPRQATRSRNFYSPVIHIPSITVKWQLQKNTKIQLTSSAVIGQRRSVIFDRPATIRDTIRTNLMYNNRQVDIDRFNSYTYELRVLQHYNVFGLKHHVVAGVQWINNHLHRTQLGKGTTDVDFDLSLVDGTWGRDMHFRTKNLALFAENSFSLSHKMSINVGMRWEKGHSTMDGKIVYYPENEIPVLMERQFPLLGLGFNYTLQDDVVFYGGFSQTYRPTLFKDIIPTSIFEKVDPNIRDADGYNAELGCRGSYSFLKWDITAFVLQYNQRFGTLALTDSLGNFFTYRTNIGNSTTKGLEIFVQAKWALTESFYLTLFTSTSLMDGRYTSGNLRFGNENVDIRNNKIESVPNLITRNGLTLAIKKLSITTLVSHTSDSFADPFNTVIPNATGTVGLVPAYTIWDVNATFTVSKNVEIRAGLNNVLNNQYFTKRPVFYPGPGIWPSDGRNGNVSFIFRW